MSSMQLMLKNHSAKTGRDKHKSFYTQGARASYINQKTADLMEVRLTL